MREHKHQYIAGDNWVVCDVCGLDFRASEIRKRWDNLYVCQKDWEPDHPQKYVKAKLDKIVANIVRPELDSTQDMLTDDPDTVGAGWTDNGDFTYTSDGSQASSTITWNNAVEVNSDYSIMLYVIKHDNGTVKAGVDDSSIETDATAIPGVVTDSGTATSTDIVITGASNFKGTVSLSVSKKPASITQDDL